MGHVNALPARGLEAQTLAWGLCRRTSKWLSSRDTCHRNQACVITLDLRQRCDTQKAMETWNFTLTDGTTRAHVMSVLEKRWVLTATPLSLSVCPQINGHQGKHLAPSSDTPVQRHPLCSCRNSIMGIMGAGTPNTLCQSWNDHLTSAVQSLPWLEPAGKLFRSHCN